MNCESNNHKFEPVIIKQTEEVNHTSDKGFIAKSATIRSFETVLFCAKCGMHMPIGEDRN